MRLKHITFTGIDAKTDIKRLQEIIELYPIAEFGVLTSYHWQENGNRYPDPSMFSSLLKVTPHLSLHLCGKIAHDAACGLWQRVDEHVEFCLPIFRRIQLNIGNRLDNPKRCCRAPFGHQEVIIQVGNARGIDIYNNTRDGSPFITMLLDASGGRGIETPLEVFPTRHKIGYAGGFNPDNVADRLSFLMENVETGTFWIDMESGVRTNDWFDLDKVVRVLEICQPIINQHNDSAE